MIHGLDVPLGKIHHVHVVSVPRPVTCSVVITVDGDLIPPPNGHLDIRLKNIRLKNI